MRVLFVHDVMGDLGGAEANVRHVAAGLKQRDCEVALLYGAETGSGGARFREIFPDRFQWPASESAVGVAEARHWDPDVVYVHKLANLDVLQALVDSGMPLVRMVHDHDMYCQRSYRYFPWSRQICTRKAGYGCAVTCSVLVDRSRVPPLKLAWPGDKLRELALCRKFRRHVVVTEFMKRELELHEFDSSRITILPPVPRAAPPEYRPEYRLPLVLYVGQLIRGKGMDVMIRALGRCVTPGWRCLVIGDGKHRAACERETRLRGLTDRITFTGWVDQDSLHEYYQDARVAVIPSVWPEPIATIGLELMQHSIPVVAFDAGGIRDWLKNGENGFLVPLWDLDAMAQRVDTLLGDSELCRRMGADGLAKARAWYQQDRYFAEIREVLAREVD